MLKIYARYGTSEKILIYSDRGSIENITHQLSEEYGGYWVLVDVVDVNKGEILKFDDGLKYLGFNPEIKRYTTAITKLKIT